ncbi:hypothetical protein LCGC14_1291840 [marine sediment metagenome]|uniref:Uncharacterized protein n=1 Tax=marine sediment metagenome TaxID=412755 RepID=A0A0F9NV35_9ZZZZ
MKRKLFISALLVAIAFIVSLSVPVNAEWNNSGAWDSIKLLSRGNASSTGVVGTTNINWAADRTHTFTFGNGNETLTFSAPRAGEIVSLTVIQFSTGGQTITWPTIKWPGGVTPTLSAGNNDEDNVFFIYNGTDYINIGFAADVQ